MIVWILQNDLDGGISGVYASPTALNEAANKMARMMGLSIEYVEAPDEHHFSYYMLGDSIYFYIIEKDVEE